MPNVHNIRTQTGTQNDPSLYSRPGIKRELSTTELENLACHLLLMRVCTAYPDSAIMKGWEIGFGDEVTPELKAKFATEDRDLKVANHFNEADYLAAIYGGAVIIIYLDDGIDPSKPVDKSKIHKVTKLKVLHSKQIYPLILGNENPNDVEHYQLYYLDNNQQEFLIHSDRILRFDGTRVPPEVQRKRGGWSPSVLELIWDDYNSYVSGLAATNSLIKDFSIYLHKIKGLAEVQKAEDEEQIKEYITERVRMLRQGLSNYGGAVIDLENEDISYQTRSFAGIEQITEKLREHFIGVTGLPHTKLFGESPSGLGATGDSEERDWAQEVLKFQVSNWQPKLMDLYNLMFRAKDGTFKGKPPKDWKINFHSILEVPVEKKLNNAFQQSSIDNTYFSIGALTPEEIRKSRFEGAELSFETTLDEKSWKKQQAQDGGDLYPKEQDSVFGGDDYGEQLDPELAELFKGDSADRAKRYIHFNGMKIGITHEIGETRFKGAKPLRATYGYISGTYGQAMDGMAIDIYTGNQYDNREIYKVLQLDEDGKPDEEKWFAAFSDRDRVESFFKSTHGKKRFGGIKVVPQEDINKIIVRKDSVISIDPVDELVKDTLIDGGKEIFNDWLLTTRQWLNKQDSLDEALAQSDELFDLLGGDRFGELMAERNLLSDLQGRDSVVEEAVMSNE